MEDKYGSEMDDKFNEFIKFANAEAPKVATNNLSGKWYAMVSANEAVLCSSLDELWNAIIDRKVFYCEVFVSKSNKTLQQIIFQRYPQIYFSKGNKNIKALQLPTINCNNKFFLHNDIEALEVIDKSLITRESSTSGYWAVTGVNGFYVADNLQELFNRLLFDQLVACVGQVFSDWKQAVYQARSEYVRRFYQRYPAISEYANIPTEDTAYIDEHFEQREKRLSESREWRKNAYRLYRYGY